MLRNLCVLGLVIFAGFMVASAQANPVYDSTSTWITFNSGTVVEEGQETAYNSTGETPFTTANGLTNLVSSASTFIKSREMTNYEAFLGSEMGRIQMGMIMAPAIRGCPSTAPCWSPACSACWLTLGASGSKRMSDLRSQISDF